jgi:multiple sugar transport system permease protein
MNRSASTGSAVAPAPHARASALPRSTWVGRIIVAFLVVFALLPILWLAYSAFLPKEAVFNGEAIPRGFTFENFRALPFDELIRPLIVSLVLSSVVALAQLVLALPAAFAMRAGTNMLWFYLLVLPISAELLLIPLYGVMRSVPLVGGNDVFGNGGTGLLNNPLSLVLPFVANPFTIFLLYSGMVRLPWAYIEAAKLDGANTLGILTRVVGPLLRPEMTAAAVLAFAAHWNLVLFPKVMLDSKAWWTVQVALADMLRKDPNAWGKLGAAAMLTSIPILILYILFERRVTRTIEGGLK